MNTMAAPWNTPSKPYGSTGDQFTGFTYHMPMAMNSTTTATSISTTILLTRLDSLMPNANRPAMIIAMQNAGRLNSVSLPGIAPAAAVSTSGRVMPKPAKRLWK